MGVDHRPHPCRVSPNGRTLYYEYALEDPVYLTGPKRGRVALTRVHLDTPMYPYVCDIESAQMWSRTRGDSPLRVTPPN